MKEYICPASGEVTHRFISDTLSSDHGKRYNLTDADDSVQLAVIHLSAKGQVDPHTHIRGIKPITHIPIEVWICFSGTAKVDIIQDFLTIDTILFRPMNILVTYPGGGHSITTSSSGFKFLEFKNSVYMPSLTSKLAFPLAKSKQ